MGGVEGREKRRGEEKGGEEGEVRREGERKEKARSHSLSISAPDFVFRFGNSSNDQAQHCLP